MSTLNCFEEVRLAEKLVELNPFGDMVRFARTGGEANSIAIRIARAASGRDNVAICGYHGWHDWYLASNLNNGDDLSSHLLSGLSTLGVPNSLKNTVFPFEYNDYESLFSIVQNENIGVIMMEVIRNFEPKNDFLTKVRELANKKNIVLIFDECTSAFRETYGGIYLKYNVNPDIAMFGKTIGNGYALTAVVGKKEVMEVAQDSFISSTFWTERIGPTAALATLKEMEKISSWEKITYIGNKVRKLWIDLANKYKLKISVSGLPAISTYSFKSENSLKYKTLITQEMLKKGFLASTNFYACISHTDEIINSYFDALDDVYNMISKCDRGDEKIDNLLEGPVCHSGFKRLN
jgi:glutamate-1-semialdehyde aminotransferase